jgi:ATP-binding cassette, subfamily C, bacterial exporter for protease/lipase
MSSTLTTPPNELMQALRKLRSALLTVGIFSGFLNVMMIVPALYSFQVFDRVLGSRNLNTLLVLTILVLGAYLFVVALETIRSWILIRVGARLDDMLADRVLRASFDRVLRQPGSSPTQPMVELGTLRQSLTGPGLIAICDAPWMPLYLLVISIISTELALFTLAGAVVLVVIALLNERLAKAVLADAQKASAQAQKELGSHLQNAEVIEAMGMLGVIRNRWKKMHDKEIGLQSVASDRAAIMGSLSKFVRISMQSLTMGLGAVLVLEGKITAGMMIGVSLLTSRALAPAESLVAHWPQIEGAKLAYLRLKELLTVFPVRPQFMPLPAPMGHVAFEAVATAAPGTRQAIIKQISFTLQPGDCVAVIGASGAGKSTLAKLLVGVWPAMSGTVRLDGADLFRWNKEEVGPHIGYLPQDIELFDGTVAENIARFGEVDPEQVVLAAQRVGFHAQILRLPQGYDTPLGSGGALLSGGQRQRIGLARALYGDPVLVVLDEPNSNLDDMGEKALSDALKDLSQRGKTSVLVTHRPSVLAVANKLMVLKDGVIAAFGPRDEVLMAINGRPPMPTQATAPSPAPSAAPVAAPAMPERNPPPVLNQPVTAPPKIAVEAPKPAPKPGMPPFDLKFSE